MQTTLALLEWAMIAGSSKGFFVPCLDILWKNDGSLLSYVWIR